MSVPSLGARSSPRAAGSIASNVAASTPSGAIAVGMLQPAVFTHCDSTSVLTIAPDAAILSASLPRAEQLEALERADAAKHRAAIGEQHAPS